ncbi:uncharacterized protein LOC117175053 isoform X3 [Belonocnema kinseyi]|uniref:uncharacterized protein LOC117175053 isoform X3 n=1 Tax=Belonocnema kinseyi TaxID=2817044 RepID=UPI00143DBBAC|nr:uncharacterized protein LOC117175053 isoform X3 [Belonocnema kinseyi]
MSADNDKRDNEDTFNFFLEDVLVISDCSFITALQLLFGSFFIFNKSFPKSNSKTLDFI